MFALHLNISIKDTQFIKMFSQAMYILHFWIIGITVLMSLDKFHDSLFCRMAKLTTVLNGLINRNQYEVG